MIHFGPCRVTAEADIFVQLNGTVPPFSDGGTTFNNFEFRANPNPSLEGDVRGFQRRQSARITGIDFDRCERRGHYWIRFVGGIALPSQSPFDEPTLTVTVHLADQNGNVVQEDILRGSNGTLGGIYAIIPPVGEVSLAVVDGQIVTNDGEAGVFQSAGGLDMRILFLVERNDFSFILESTLSSWSNTGSSSHEFTAQRLSMCD